MDKYGYVAIANHIRDNYNNIINKQPINNEVVIDGTKYTVTYPTYNLASHYTFDVLDLSAKKVAHGEVSGRAVGDKVIRFYKGTSVVYEENL